MLLYPAPDTLCTAQLRAPGWIAGAIYLEEAQAATSTKVDGDVVVEVLPPPQQEATNSGVTGG